MKEILEFIHRRFPIDSHFLDMNCYYFALILKDRFPQGEIFYDVIYGHFMFLCEGDYYDWTGCIKPKGTLIKWDEFEKYDSLQKQIVIRDCLL